MALNAKSMKLLQVAHPDLIKVAVRAEALSTIKFQIGCVGRTLAQQKKNVAAGVSHTMRSRHLIAENGYSHALDFIALVNGKVTWAFNAYARVADAFKQASKDLGIPIEWGGDWKGLRDGPHIQLPWAQYPGTKGHNAPPAAPSPDEFASILPGAIGDDVAALQADLNTLGASPALKIDRDFGPRTRDALKQVTAKLWNKPQDVVTPALRAKIVKAAMAAVKKAQKEK